MTLFAVGLIIGAAIGFFAAAIIATADMSENAS